jgi:hypothetical protein
MAGQGCRTVPQGSPRQLRSFFPEWSKTDSRIAGFSSRFPVAEKISPWAGNPSFRWHNGC